jgi:hypothetical protein
MNDMNDDVIVIPKTFIEFLKNENSILNQRAVNYLIEYNRNKRKIQNKINYEKTVAQISELNKICIELNINIYDDMKSTFFEKI